VKGKQLGIHCYIDRREGGGKEIAPWLLLLLGQPKSPSLHPVWPSPGAKPFALHASQRQPSLPLGNAGADCYSYSIVTISISIFAGES